MKNSRTNPPLLLSPAILFSRSSAAAVHRYFTRETLRRARADGRLSEVLLAQLGWYLCAYNRSEKERRRHAHNVEERTGTSRLRRLLELWGLAILRSIPAPTYYLFRLYEPEHRRHANHFLHRFETKKQGVFLFLNDRIGGNRRFLRNKRLFFDACSRNGLSNASVLLELRNGKVEFVAHRGPGLPETDLIVKPTRGKGGGGVARFEFRDGAFVGHEAERVSPAELLESLRKQSRRGALLVQPRLHNHPDLADLGGGALTTVRILTIRNEQGRAEATNASFRVGLGGAVVDNMHRGGIAAAVDISTGRVGPAIALSSENDWMEKHPETGAPIAGRILPDWQAAIDLVCRAHDAFPHIVLAGWDVALLADGPSLVEGNSAPCVNLIQRPLGGPIGNGRFGELLAYHIRSVERGAKARPDVPA